ncbi:DUF862-domain-containing protein [Myriangium duriaei CBS 260.36]|uniref:DUF862-domain-containing protein n=1 Tax=Myriangium duriaei CBS 260.36 TaxID=1168546 RepID=A0A9P4IYW2_9PEZI|nr:DUF862-domain-containing protein [Myriangium duriaei CBS 260.36]
MASWFSSNRTRKSSPNLPSSPQRTEIIVHVYDLLPPSKLSSLLWILGVPLIHTSLYIPAHNLEYAFGGHNVPRLTGVYSTAPLSAPPGSHHRRTLRLGSASCSAAEASHIVNSISADFPGIKYDLLTRNCNHFTDTVLRRLLGRGLPAWCNRAAALGVALPCIVPRDWVRTPGVETVDGTLVEEEPECDEQTGMLMGETEDRPGRKRSECTVATTIGPRIERSVTPPPRVVDTSGHSLPAAERAPVPKR